jgi:glycosyltransferase involved in cell wall biosynthesis
VRIGLVSDCYLPQVGGIEMQVHDLALHLREAGHEVVVVTSIDGPAQVDGIKVHRLQVPLLPFNIPFTPRTFRLVAEILRREQVDVAHFHGGIVSPLAYFAAHSSQQAGIPTVITTHCLWSYATPVFAGLDKLFRWRRWNAVMSAVSGVAAAPIRRIVGDERDVIVLPNGIDNDVWQVSPLDDAGDESDDDTVTIVSVMRLAPRKRPMHLLKMIRKARDRLAPDTSMRVIIIGDGPERASLERYIRANDLSDVVELVGRRTREEIRETFAAADVFVAPANLESFGIAALEARCAGLPVVAKARTGIREFVEHGREGLLARTDRDMVDQIVRLVRDTELRLVITKNNRETSSPVDWSVVVQLNEAAYAAAVAGETRRPLRPARVTTRAIP